jgi:hypothetical protein
MNGCVMSIHALNRGMALVNDKLFQMRTTEEFLRRVDDWRRGQEDLPSRTEAIRRLVEVGLNAAAERTKAG